MVDWLQISQVSGSSGTYTVTVTASSTSELTARTTSLTVTAHAPAGGIWTDKTETISIRQRGTGELVVTPTVLNFVASGGSATIEITTYLGDWSLTILQGSDFITVSQDSGTTGQTTITVTADTNSGSTRRYGRLSITDGESTIVVYVAQYGVLSVSPTWFMLPTTGRSESFTVTSSVNWSINNVPDWITMSQVSGHNGTTTVTLTADTNTGAIRTDSFNVTDGHSTVTCNLHQDARELIVSPTIFVFPYSASTSTLLIDAPGNWFINKDGQWFDFSSMSGTGYSVVTVSATTNTGSGARNSTFTVDDGQHTPITCAIGQSASGDTPTPTAQSEYFTVEVLTGGTLSYVFYAIPDAYHELLYISYRTNGGNWQSFPYTGSTVLNVSEGDVIEFKSIAHTYRYSEFSGSTAHFNLKGNIMSLLFAEDFENHDEFDPVCAYTFSRLFYLTNVHDASELVLPATELPNQCYNEMFSGCGYLTDAPVLPATTLGTECYRQMFRNCHHLTTAPALPATTLAVGCYDSMFERCDSLTTAPTLPATTLASLCYYNMFSGCTSLTTTPTLYVTTLATSCYRGMFAGCTSLTTAPVLPSTTLASNCYYGMFEDCTSLTTAPVLPSTTLTNYCYTRMFKGCTSLTTAPALPATTLADECYSGMFSGCTSLTTAPDLPAATIEDSYNDMFNGCTSLNYIKCLAYNNIRRDYTANWTNNVASSGTFVRSVSATTWSVGNSGIPYNWVVEAEGDGYRSEYLTFNVLSNGTISFSHNQGATPLTIEYNINNSSWVSITSSEQGSAINVTNGDAVKVRGNNDQYNSHNFSDSTAQFNLEGNIMSLVYGGSFLANDTVMPSGFTFTELFGGCSIVSAENLVMPATATTLYSYSRMFSGCTSLTKAPELPATVLGDWCYNGMFAECTSLTNAPSLPATALTDYCYNDMFSGCTSLTTAPALPATTLGVQCYHGMFQECTSLTTAPSLPATTLSDGCYYAMFAGTSLTTAPTLPATTLAQGCYEAMFSGCTLLTTAPVLSASSMEDYCYAYMFDGCTSLASVTFLGTSTATDSTNNWLNNVAASGVVYIGTFAPNILPQNSPSGVPVGWTLQRL